MSNNQNADAIRFAPRATIYFAPRNTDVSDLLEDVTAPVPSEFTAMGYTAEDGIELTPSVETNPVPVHQSATPVKYVVASASATLAFTMMQFDENTVPVYFGAEFVEGASGTMVLDLSSTPSLAENAVIVEWGDFREDDEGELLSGTKSRLILPRGMLSERDAITLTRTDANQLGVTIQALDLNGSLGKVLMKTSDGGGENGGEDPSP